MCVTPAGKIGNCTCGMPKLLPHSGKKSSLLSLFNRSKTVSSHFLFLPLFHPEGSGVLSLEGAEKRGFTTEVQRARRYSEIQFGALRENSFRKEKSLPQN